MIPADIVVVIPTFNRAPLIPAALDSVIKQTYPGLIDVVVIDDGSTDDTSAVVGRYVERYGAENNRRKIRYERLEKAGVVTARNRGIAMSSAPYVAFLDSDDYWDPQKIARQVEALEQDPGIGVVHTSFRYVDEADAFQDDGPQRLKNPCVGDCVDTLLNEDLVVFSTVLMRRSVIDQAAAAEPHGLPFDPRWTNAQDYDLLLRAARLSLFAYIPEPLTYYRLHGGHGAMGNLPRAFKFHCTVQIDFIRRFGQELGYSQRDARQRVANFLFARAEACFWRRELEVAHELCELARTMGVYGKPFADLEKRTSRPAWMYKAKDLVDRVIGRHG